VVVAGGILNRLNVSIFGHWSYYGPVYFPSWMEIVLSLALFSIGIVIFIVAVKYLPVFPKEEPAPQLEVVLEPAGVVPETVRA